MSFIAENTESFIARHDYALCSIAKENKPQKVCAAGITREIEREQNWKQNIF